MKRICCLLVLLAVTVFFATGPLMAQEGTTVTSYPMQAVAAADADDDDTADVPVTDEELTIDNAGADADVADENAKPGVKAPDIGKDAPMNKFRSAFSAERAAIQKLIRQRFFAKAEKQLEALRDKVKSSKFNEEFKKRYMASLERREKVTIFSAQGQYQKAADAVRQAISYNELKGDKERLLKVQEKVGRQKEWLEIRTNHEKKLRDLLETKQPLLKEKLAILKQMDAKRKLSDAELKKLQGALKEVNGRLAKINKELQETHRVFAVKRVKMHKAGVRLSAAQHRKLFPLVMRRMMVRFENYRLHKQIARHLTNISEDTEVSWDGLKNNFAALAKLQDQVWSLRKQLDALAGKAPLSEADYGAAKALRAQLEKAIEASEKLMNKVEDAFIDQKVFGKLGLKEKLEFVKLFRDVWSRDKEFDSLKPSLEELYNKIFDNPVVGGPEPVPQPPVEPQPAPVDIEGAGFIIQEGNIFLLRFGDKILWPNNLPARYMVNKLEVKFAAQFIYRTMQVDEDSASMQKKYPEISFTYVNAPQLPDEPFGRPADQATPTRIIEENIDNESRPSNLMNAF